MRNALAALRVNVQRQHPGIGQFQQVRGFTAGGSAGIEQLQRLAGSGCQPGQQELRGQLGTGILY